MESTVHHMTGQRIEAKDIRTLVANYNEITKKFDHRQSDLRTAENIANTKKVVMVTLAKPKVETKVEPEKKSTLSGILNLFRPK
jgi:hypothetical protein